MFDETSRKGPVTPTAFVVALGSHIALALLIWSMGSCRMQEEVVIPIDMTIVPPWAQQTDDPDPDPNPPPKPTPKVEQPKPPPEPKEVERKVDAVEKVVEKPKPKPKEKINLREEAKLVTKPLPQPEKLDLRSEATKFETKIIPPPTMPVGKGTAADKPLSMEDYLKKLNEGYRVGAHNQLAPNETSRCFGLILAAIRRECDKDSFASGIPPIDLAISFGPGGRITGCSIIQSSGNAEADQMVKRAVARLGSVAGLSATFLQTYPKVQVRFER